MFRKEDFLEENEKKQEEDVLLTEQQVWSVVEFARAMSGGIYGTYLNPDLISGRMKDITMNPMQATQDMLDNAMKSPKDNEANIQHFSQSFELTSMVYKRLISYLANMLAFDITYTSNAKPDEYKTPKFKKDLDIMERFLEQFDYKKEFRTAVREMLRNDAFFGCFRNTGDKYIIQELPPEYCKITGRWEGGLLFSFNMYWFLQPGVDIDMYPPFFKKKYKELWESSRNTTAYYPSISPELRDRSGWIYWVDVPVDIAVCFKLTSELATRLPYFTPLFSDLILQGQMRNLQKNMNMASASKMIIGEVPLLNRDIKATVKDSIAISPDLLGKFMALVRSALTESVKVASAPLQNMQGISFDADPTMYDSYLRTALASSGINTNLIFTSNVKPNAIETQLSLNVDEQMMMILYGQFEAFMDYHINKLTRHFKFFTAFEGTDFFINRNQRLDDALSLFEKGIVMPQKIAAAYGMKPAQMRRHMEESAAMGFMDMLTVPSFEQQKALIELQGKQQSEMADKQAENANVMADKQAEVSLEQTELQAKLKPPTLQKPAGEASKGRPKKSTSEISEEGMKTRETGANIGRGGKV